MYKLLVFLLALYPTVFLYNAIPNVYIDKLDNLAQSGLLFFVSHLIVFGIIFFVIHSVMRRFVSVGYMSSGKTSLIGLAIFSLMVLAVVIIVFYQVLPGTAVYAAPDLVTSYILSQPYTLILLLLPFGYLFFD
jgi:hypothetical protein